MTAHAAVNEPSRNGKPHSAKAALEAAADKPQALAVRPDNIPAGLAALDQWVVWRYVRKRDKWTKVPVNPATGRAASSTDPATWTTFDAAVAAYQDDQELDGVGFVFSPDDPFAGIDLDDARDPATRVLAPWAADILRDLDSYTEVSPSQTGVKMILRAQVPAGGNQAKLPDGRKVEMYDRGRFFALTGRRLKEYPAAVESRQPALNALHARLFGNRAAAPAAATPPPVPGGNDLPDDVLLAQARAAKNGAKFTALWGGDTSGYASQSEADLALCRLLAFWTGGDADRIDCLFRQSGLYRPKWERAKYREGTVASAVAGQQRAATPAPRSVTAAHAPPSLLTPDGRTDQANGKRFVLRYGGRVRYCAPWGQWLCWDGRRWKADDTCRVERLAKRVTDKLWEEVGQAAARLTKPEVNQAIGFGKASNSAKGVQSLLLMARSEAGVPVLPDALDRDPWLLNVLNGTLDLRTGQLHKHRRADLITKLAPVVYDPDARCPQWRKFLDRVLAGNRGLIDYLRRVVGYWLTGSVQEHCLWFLYGSGANGKSTFLLTVLALLGDYGMQAVADLLLVKKHEPHPTERADLFGKRFAATIEVEQGKRMAEALLKQLTGGDKVRARRMRQDFFEFDATFKIAIAANHKPVVRGTDHGVWRRIKLVPFTVTIPDHEKDKALPQKLQDERSGILNWALAGCRAWQRDGLGEPDEVTQATQQYRDESDTLGRFLREECVLDAKAKVRSSVLLEAYQKWSGDKRLTPNEFAAQMQAKGYENRRGKGNGRFWHGLELVSLQDTM